jgi:hypothetical protein
MASSSNGSRIGNMVLVLALSNSETSYYALEWTLDIFFSPMGSSNRNQLVLIHAKRLASSVTSVWTWYEHIADSIFFLVSFGCYNKWQ